MTDQGRDLLLAITRCPNVVHIKTTEDRNHPCFAVVDAQPGSLDDFQVPEPWSGHLAEAPILFISSNPGLDKGGHLPMATEDDELTDIFENAFKGDKPGRISDGVRIIRPDGAPGRVVAYWRSIRALAEEALGRQANPGFDYALTEVVHCKSDNEKGVGKALLTCADKWLEKVLKVSQARLLVVLGANAGWVFRTKFGLGNDRRFGSLQLGGCERHLALLPHPNAHIAGRLKTFAGVLSPSELGQVKAALRA